MYALFAFIFKKYFAMTKKRLALKLKEQLSDHDINAEVKQPKKRLKIEEQLVQLDESNLLNITNLNRLNSEFYNQNCIELSKSLLGKYLIRIIRADNSEQKCLVGKIVECEAYLGGDDKASHTYNGKKTERLTAMYMKPGTLYGKYTIEDIRQPIFKLNTYF